MRIRAVDERDVGVWAQMRHALWPDADANELAQECAAFFVRPTLIDAVFVAENESGALVGFVELSLRSHAEGCSASPVPYVEGWYVASEARRDGVGRALIDAAEDWALKLGHAEIASDALLDNSVSIEAHAALGFAVVERAVHFRKPLRR
jgi:aminoglycoside 6'-N-acetyltransferase I